MYVYVLNHWTSKLGTIGIHDTSIEIPVRFDVKDIYFLQMNNEQWTMNNNFVYPDIVFVKAESPLISMNNE